MVNINHLSETFKLEIFTCGVNLLLRVLSSCIQTNKIT